jgi:hypothetical protein
LIGFASGQRLWLLSRRAAVGFTRSVPLLYSRRRAGSTGRTWNERRAFVARRCVLAVAVGSISAALAVAISPLATTALASSGMRSVPGLPAGPRAVDSPALYSAVIKDSGFAGYVRNGGGTNASFNMTATLVVPTLSRCGSVARAIAPDIEVSNRRKIGSHVGLFVGCYRGKPDYFPFLDVNNNNTDYAAGTVQPGDHIVLRLIEGPTTSELTFQDLTHNLVKVRTGSGLKGLGFPEVGDDSWLGRSGAELGVPDFGTVAFGHCEVNGAALGSGGTAKSRAVLEYDRASKSGTVQISIGPLTAGGEAFTTYFKHS